jgi:glycosyltransferase involved in cell wall biosynthesis
VGSAQALDVVLSAAERLLDCPAVQFVILGDGIEKERLARLAQSKALPNVRFLGSRPPEQMAAYYALADVLLLHLKDDPKIAITIPSKTYAYLASQKPILAAARGDAAGLIEEIGAGLVCPPQDPAALEQAVRCLYAMPLAERQKMGRAGRQAFLTRFTRQALVRRYQALFESLLAQG